MSVNYTIRAMKLVHLVDRILLNFGTSLAETKAG